MHKFLIVSGLALLCALGACAYEFQPLGFESIGMGGAGVASANGPMAGYYNPALLSVSRHIVEFNLGAGAAIREHNLADSVDKLAKLDLDQTLSELANNYNNQANNVGTTQNNIKQAKQILTDMSDGNNYLSVMPAVALGVQMKRFGVGIYFTSEATAQAMIDADYLGLIVDGGGQYYMYNPDNNTYTNTTLADYEAHSLQYALDNNKTYIRMGGLAIAEVPISYAMTFNLPIGTLAVGASAKLMQADIFEGRSRVDTESGDLGSDLTNGQTAVTSLGIDLGFLYTPKLIESLRVGLVAKNLNSPTFETDAAEYTVDPMYRAGVSYGFFNRKLEFAADLDLSKNKTASGGDSQYAGGGVNFHPNSWFSLRGGLMKNLANSDEGTVATVGLGIGLKQLQIDLSAQLSSEKGEIDGQEIPSYAKANLSIVSRW